jgi:isoleucyl-tRNA synthetase
MIRTPGLADLGSEILTLVAEELNVGAVAELGSVPGPAEGDAGHIEGWAVASDRGETVALDTRMTAELSSSGLAREAVRAFQAARRADGLAVGEPIALRWSAAEPELATALSAHGPRISAEVLAAEYAAGSAAQCAAPEFREHDCARLGLRYWIRPLRPG